MVRVYTSVSFLARYRVIFLDELLLLVLPGLSAVSYLAERPNPNTVVRLYAKLGNRSAKVLLSGLVVCY